ncbi:MAG: hypothetical protein LGB78_08490 [Sulfurovum sp.]|nr:hypothetical protein [Sulfurovum sp.]MCB4760133.1 hypothetical protein [Sulfurovum sp.]MCB4761884.1 hypothetical protein [Sulfurovum sp.]MCB4763918.1 hypothetical protein [Sulfurovum sp.]MCB4778885.1 hypothetical protein [Sulfurovum sp.]
MIKTIDHIIIHTPTPQKTLSEMEDAFGIKAYVPLRDYGYFQSAMIRFANVDIEILKMGEKEDFVPYLYGIAFEPTKSVWQTIDVLEKEQISHSLPSKTTVSYDDISLSWSAITLDKLLDNAIKVPCGNGYMYANNWLGKSMARLTDKLMKVDTIRKAVLKDVGRGMVFFCVYEPYPKKERKMASKALMDSDGGKYKIAKVQSIVIKRDKQHSTWDKLSLFQDENSAQIEFETSEVNKISHVVLKSSEDYHDKEIMIGDVRFVLE